MRAYPLAILVGCAMPIQAIAADDATTSPVDPAVSIEQSCPLVLDVTAQGFYNSRAKSTVPPQYPSRMHRANKQGAVTIIVLIGLDGSVLKAEVQTSTHSDFSVAALASVRKWRWPEEQMDGKPTCVRAIVEVIFKLV